MHFGTCIGYACPDVYGAGMTSANQADIGPLVVTRRAVQQPRRAVQLKIPAGLLYRLDAALEAATPDGEAANRSGTILSAIYRLVTELEADTGSRRSGDAARPAAVPDSSTRRRVNTPPGRTDR